MANVNFPESDKVDHDDTVIYAPLRPAPKYQQYSRVRHLKQVTQ